MIRRLIKATWGVTAIVLTVMLAIKAAPTMGPAIETAVAPIRVNSRNVGVRRYDDRICWTWSSDKLRAAFSDDVDIHLDVLDAVGQRQKTFVPALTREDTGEPWQSGLAIGVGHWDLPYCIALPRRLVGSSARLRIRFTPQFRGWRDLWTLPIWTPDIIDPAEAAPP